MLATILFNFCFPRGPKLLLSLLLFILLLILTSFLLLYKVVMEMARRQIHFETVSSGYIICKDKLGAFHQTVSHLS